MAAERRAPPRDARAGRLRLCQAERRARVQRQRREGAGACASAVGSPATDRWSCRASWPRATTWPAWLARPNSGSTRRGAGRSPRDPGRAVRPAGARARLFLLVRRAVLVPDAVHQLRHPEPRPRLRRRGKRGRGARHRGRRLPGRPKDGRDLPELGARQCREPAHVAQLHVPHPDPVHHDPPRGGGRRRRASARADGPDHGRPADHDAHSVGAISDRARCGGVRSRPGGGRHGRERPAVRVRDGEGLGGRLSAPRPTAPIDAGARHAERHVRPRRRRAHAANRRHPDRARRRRGERGIARHDRQDRPRAVHARASSQPALRRRIDGLRVRRGAWGPPWIGRSTEGRRAGR